jgi:HEAT repeat protein
VPVTPVIQRAAERLARACAAMSVCAALAWGTVGEAQAPFTVRWANDRLSVRASDAPLQDVVAEVARQSGLKVVGADKLQGRLTVDFAELSAVDALKALLTDVNYFVQQEPEVEKGRIGLILRVHSMARVDAAPLSAPGSAKPALHVPALDAILESEAEDLADEKEEEADDPDIDAENRQYLAAAQDLVLSGAFGSAASVTALERYMQSDNPQIRLEALKAFSQRPISDSLLPLLEALEDDAIEVRRIAIDALGRASDPESLLKVGLLLEKDPDISLRYNALRILVLRADPSSTVHLRNALKDEDPTVREVATEMLAEFERLARAKKEKQPPAR